MLLDFHYIFNWWLTLFLLGILSLPLTSTLFHKFWDKGYIFSKTISLVLLTYFSLIFGVFKILPFSSSGLFLLISFFILFDVWFLLKQKRYKQFFLDFKKHYHVFIFEEIIFFLILTAWSYVRGFAPDIQDLEKYMDWGFVNSALRSKFLPPTDMWFAGEAINYYYFGHLIFALITKLSKVVSSVGYNLSIATVCSLTFTSAFSLVSNIAYLSFIKNKKLINSSFKKAILAGLISALLLTFGGNLHSAYKIIKLNYQQNNNHFIFSQEAVSKATSSYWYPDATRFIGHDPDINDKTIHEFPLYSFVVADLHGHMNDIFVVLFFLAFLFVSLEVSRNFFNWKFIVGSGFILSVCYMTNAWDFAVYGLVLAIFSFLINFDKTSKSLIKTMINGLMIIVFWYIFSYPFSINFVPMMEGIKISDGHSPFYQLFILYGGFWIICVPFVISIIKRFFRNWKLEIRNSDLFIFSLILTATLLVIIPEIIYIKDIYIYDYRRANTMFKLVYQAFILYSLASGYILIRFSSLFKLKIFKYFYYFCFLSIFCIHMIYPYFAIRSYYGNLKDYKGLDGLKYLEQLYPDNYQAILWLNKNISGQPVILEAVGDSYTTFNQVSSATGLPTVEGWIVHEWLWRGGYDAPAARQKDVETIYTSTNLDEIKNLISKYHIQYIFVGAKEYEKYEKLDSKIFEKLGGKIVFQSGQTSIYQL